MSKDTEKTVKNATPKIGVKMPAIIKSPRYYQLLVSDRWKSFRKELCADLDEVFVPKVGFATWKQRFLKPTNIPKKDFEFISLAMEEHLARKLQEQTDYVKEQINIKLDSLKKTNNEIEKLENILKQSEIAIKIYTNEKNKI